MTLYVVVVRRKKTGREYLTGDPEGYTEFSHAEAEAESAKFDHDEDVWETYVGRVVDARAEVGPARDVLDMS